MYFVYILECSDKTLYTGSTKTCICAQQSKKRCALYKDPKTSYVEIL